MLIVKLGGSANIKDEFVLDDIAVRVQAGEKLILVHGGSDETNQVATDLGHPPKFVTSVSGFESRYTDRRTMEIFSMVYCGKRNKSIVEGLQKRGVNAVGLSGIDGRVFEGPMKGSIKVLENGKKKVLRGDHSGKVTKVNRALLDLLLENGYLPVLTPPAIDEASSTMMNIDGDRAAAELAKAYSAESLVILSTVPGLLRDLDAPHDSSENLISTIEISPEVDPYESAKGRMKKKIMGAVEALDGGASRVILSTANIEQPISHALAGNGTHIYRAQGANQKAVG